MRAPDPPADGWRSLFDGRTADAWRGWRSDRLPAGWRIVDGALTRVAPAGDIVTREQFDDFELALEWTTGIGLLRGESRVEGQGSRVLRDEP